MANLRKTVTPVFEIAALALVLLDIGLGFQSGLSVVLLAIILDRVTQSFGAAVPARTRRFALLERFMPNPAR